jgi:phospholipase C
LAHVLDIKQGGSCSSSHRSGRLGVFAASLLVGLGISAAARAAPIDGIHNIQHVVMIMQENRSFDSYFGTYPGARGIPGDICVPDPANGGCQAPYHNPRDLNYGGPHGLAVVRTDINGGKMNGYVASNEQLQGCKAGEPRCLPCNSPNVQAGKCIDVMGYHDAREIPNYWTYAQNFVLQDNMFEASSTWSMPEHLFLVSGWSAACPNGDSNPMDCVNSLSPPGVATAPRAWTDITYLMYKAHVSWRYYIFQGAEPDCQSDEAITCAPTTQSPKTPGIWNQLPDFTDVKQDGQLGNIQSLTNLYTAVHEPSSCGLPNVSWVIPNQHVSEHPQGLISTGQSYVTTLVNSIMRSPCWGSTAIFVSWDDFGGFYDHVLPPLIDQNGYGLRVPGLVISPYAKKGFVDHQQLSHDAYLKFIEDAFLGGARLNPATDGRPDRRPTVREEAAGLGDLTSSFDFTQTPRPALLLSPHPEPGPASHPPGSNVPIVETGVASSIKQTSATLNATVNPNEGAVSDCHFEYGTSTSYGSTAPCSSLPGSGTTPVAVSAAVTGLTANTTYHFRIVASNPAGVSPGADQAFTTVPSSPVVETEPASLVKQTSATLNATVNPNEGAVSDCHFEYGTSTSYGSTAPCSSLPGSGSTPVAVSAAVIGLSANTAYHFRIVASNPGGSRQGTDQSFTTLPNPPIVETGTASTTKQTSATLNATVNPNEGTVSDCHFEYGTSTSYGSTAPCSSLPGSGSTPVAVSAAVTGLTANTTYHFRIAASNPGGASQDADHTFGTLPNAPVVETGVPSPVKPTTAKLNATVNPNEGAVSDCHFEYGRSTAYGSSAPCASLPGSGSTPVGVSAQVTGLSPNTAYHFRIIASNQGGTNEGADGAFTTESRPEYGRCVKVAAGVTGRYAANGCNSPATAESSAFEWKPGPGLNPHFTSQLKPETLATLETVGKTKVVCTGERSTGDYTGPTTTGNVVLTFTGCQGFSAPCKSAGAGEGEIVTKALEGVLGWENKAEHKIADDLFAVESAGPIAEFVCGAASMTVRGSVLGPIIAGHMLSTATLKYSEAGGKQKPERFEGQASAILESSILGGGFEQTGLTLTTDQTNGEAIEASWFV